MCHQSVFQTKNIKIYLRFFAVPNDCLWKLRILFNKLIFLYWNSIDSSLDIEKYWFLLKLSECLAVQEIMMINAREMGIQIFIFRFILCLFISVNLIIFYTNIVLALTFWRYFDLNHIEYFDIGVVNSDLKVIFKIISNIKK